MIISSFIYSFLFLSFTLIDGLPSSSSFSSSSSTPVPVFPLQLTATIQIISHLISDDSDYPPKTRVMKIYYDYVNKLARVDIEAGYEAAKQYYRYYNEEKVEYMIRLPPINDCNRAYLGEKMPYPDITDAVFIGTNVKVGNILCNYFIHSDFDTRVHIYIALTGEPVQLTISSITKSPSGAESSTDLLTYSYSNVILGPPAASNFQLPEPYLTSPRTSCERQVGGFPYLHVFHYFVRF